MSKRLLLLSNSANPGCERLAHAKDWIKLFFGAKVEKIALIGNAVFPNRNYSDAPITKLEEIFTPIFSDMGYRLLLPNNREDSPKEIIEESDAIAVTGGNTFYLLDSLYKHDLINLIKEKVEDGMPYLGWSAGSNVACPTICTTNDMPIVQPPSFKALNLIPFQINPHLPDKGEDENPGAETREDRLNEYMTANSIPVVGLRNGSALSVVDNEYQLLGDKEVRIFRKPGKEIQSFESKNLHPLT